MRKSGAPSQSLATPTSVVKGPPLVERGQGARARHAQQALGIALRGIVRRGLVVHAEAPFRNGGPENLRRMRIFRPTYSRRRIQ